MHVLPTPTPERRSTRPWRRIVAAAIGVILGFGGAAVAAAPALADVPEMVLCDADVSLFNTGYDAATGGKLPAGSLDQRWDFAVGMQTGVVMQNGIPTALPSLGDAGTWFAPTVGTLSPLWTQSPFGNADWTGSSTAPANSYMYYRLDFTLADEVDPTGFALALQGAADDNLADIWVNGASMRDAGVLGSGYYDYPFTGISDFPELNGYWVDGQNEIIVAVLNHPGAPSGLMIQTDPADDICSALLDVTKVSDSSGARTGQDVTHTITVANTQLRTVAHDVHVTDDYANGALTPVSWTCTPTGNAVCPAPSGSGALDVTVPQLVGAEGSLTFQTVSTVMAGGASTVTNTVAVSASNRYECADTTIVAADDSCAANASLTAFDFNPVAVDDSAATPAGTAVTIDVLANDSDSAGAALTPTIASSPAHGTATIGAGGSVIYTPASGFVGVDTFTYTVTNPDGGTATATVTVTVSATLSYNANGGSGTLPETVTQTTPGAVVAPQGPLTYPGHVFTGWNTAADGTGTAYQPDDAIQLTAAETVLYAQWQPIIPPTTPPTAPAVPTGTLAVTGGSAETMPIVVGTALLLAGLGSFGITGILRRRRGTQS